MIEATNRPMESAQSGNAESHATTLLALGNPMMVGILMLLLGGLWLTAQVLDVNLAQYLWQWFVIVPGLALVAIGMATRNRAAVGLLSAGCVIALTGLLMLFQQWTNMWASWAYAWALVAPGGVGLGHVVYGVARNDSDMLRTGAKLLTIAAGLFVAGLIFFEFVIGISGFGLGFWAWPLLLMLAGAALLLYSIVQGKSRGR